MDHKPLTHALFRVSPPWSAHQQHHLAYLVEFTSSIVHIPGLENVVADALSQPSLIPSQSPSALVSQSTPSLHSPISSTTSQRSPTPSLLSSDEPVFSGFNVSLLPLLQLTCPSVSKMPSSPSLSMVSVPFRAGVLLCDSSTGSLRPLVPLQL